MNIQDLLNEFLKNLPEEMKGHIQELHIEEGFTFTCDAPKGHKLHNVVFQISRMIEGAPIVIVSWIDGGRIMSIDYPLSSAIKSLVTNEWKPTQMPAVVSKFCDN